MGLFQPYQRADKRAEPEAVAAPAAPAAPSEAGGKKKIATPTRREAEQARRDRLRPVLTKKELKQREREARMAKGDEQRKAIDAQPGRQLARDYVDSRRSPLPFATPLIILVLVLAMFGEVFGMGFLLWVTMGTWVIFAMIIIEIVRVLVPFGRLHRQRLPEEPMRGLRWYAVNRAVNPRRFRMPAPRVAVGDKI